MGGYIDSGSNGNFFTDSTCPPAPALCMSAGTAPRQAVSLSVTNQGVGASGATSTVISAWPALQHSQTPIPVSPPTTTLPARSSHRFGIPVGAAVFLWTKRIGGLRRPVHRRGPWSLHRLRGFSVAAGVCRLAGCSTFSARPQESAHNDPALCADRPTACSSRLHRRLCPNLQIARGGDKSLRLEVDRAQQRFHGSARRCAYGPNNAEISGRPATAFQPNESIISHQNQAVGDRPAGS